MADPQTRSRPATIAMWSVQIFCACAFTAAAMAKLTSQPMMVDIFDHIGLGQNFRYVTGVVEIVGAIGLLVPRFTAFGALLLAVTMACAIFVHLAVIGGNPVPAIVLFTLTAGVAYVRRTDFASARHQLVQ